MQWKGIVLYTYSCKLILNNIYFFKVYINAIQPEKEFVGIPGAILKHYSD